MRIVGAAAVCASAVAAGTIASRSGSARVTPAPLSTVRREICRFVRNISVPLGNLDAGRRRWRCLHTERIARDDAGDDGRQPIALSRGAADHSPYLWHVVRLQLPPERIHHELFG